MKFKNNKFVPKLIPELQEDSPEAQMLISDIHKRERERILAEQDSILDSSPDNEDLMVSGESPSNQSYFFLEANESFFGGKTVTNQEEEFRAIYKKRRKI